MKTIDDWVNQAKEGLNKKILEDFKKLDEELIYDEIQFDLYDDRVSVDEQLEIIKQNKAFAYPPFLEWLFTLLSSVFRVILFV